MKRTIIRVSNIYVEDVFKWAYESVRNDGGDGLSAIVCKNFKEVADWFVKWYPSEYIFPLHLKKSEDMDSVGLLSGEEGIIFTDDSSINMFYGDKIFIFENDCGFGYTAGPDERVVRGIYE